jgi:hypothetical protein
VVSRQKRTAAAIEGHEVNPRLVEQPPPGRPHYLGVARRERARTRADGLSWPAGEVALIPRSRAAGFLPGNVAAPAGGTGQMVGVRGCWSQTIQSTCDVGNRPGLVSVTDGQFKYPLSDRLMALFEKTKSHAGPWRKLARCGEEDGVGRCWRLSRTILSYLFVLTLCGAIHAPVVRTCALPTPPPSTGVPSVV